MLNEKSSKAFPEAEFNLLPDVQFADVPSHWRSCNGNLTVESNKYPIKTFQVHVSQHSPSL